MKMLCFVYERIFQLSPATRAATVIYFFLIQFSIHVYLDFSFQYNQIQFHVVNTKESYDKMLKVSITTMIYNFHSQGMFVSVV